VAVQLVEQDDAAGDDAVAGAVVGGVDLDLAAGAQGVDAAVALEDAEARVEHARRPVDEAGGLAERRPHWSRDAAPSSTAADSV
jgi:hypothetical protein